MYICVYACTYCVPSRTQAHNDSADRQYRVSTAYTTSRSRTVTAFQTSTTNFEQWRRLTFEKLLTFMHVRWHSPCIIYFTSNPSRVMRCTNNSYPSLYKKKTRSKTLLRMFDVRLIENSKALTCLTTADCRWLGNLFSRLFFLAPIFPRRLDKHGRRPVQNTNQRLFD